MHIVSSAAELEDLLGLPAERDIRKVRDTLHPRYRDWISSSRLCMVATSAANGSCDVSPKGDPANSFLAVDEKTVVIPERPGNRRTDSFRNILQNPHVGLLFLIPGRPQTLRVNGSAAIVKDSPHADLLVVRGHRPTLCLRVTVQEAYFHCGKSLLRSGAWDSSTWTPRGLPSHARLVKEVEELPPSLAELEQYYGPSYSDRLYVEKPRIGAGS